MANHQREILSSTAIYSLGTLLTQFVSFLLLPLYTRYLGPEDYGVLSLLLVYQAVLSFFSEMGFVSGIMRFFPTKEGKDADTFMATALYGLLVLALFFGTVCMVSRDTLGEWIVPGLDSAGLWIALTTMTAVMTPFAKAALRTFQLRKAPLLFVAASFVQFAITLSVTVYLVVYDGAGVQGVLVGQLSGFSALVLISIAVHWSYFFSRPSLESLQTLLGFSVPLVPANIAALVIALSDRFFLERLASLREVGVYAVADKMSTVLQVLLVTSFANAWHQFVFTHQDDPELANTFAKTSRGYALLFLFAILVFSFAMPELLQFATTPEFMEGYRVVPILCVGPFMQGWVLFSYDGIHLANQTRKIPVILVSGMVLNIVLNMILIPPMGMLGAALATALAMTWIGGWAHRVSVRAFPVDYDLRSIGTLALLVGIALGMFFALEPAEWSYSIGLRILLLVGVCAGAFALRLVQAKDILMIVRKLEGRFGRA